MRRLPASLLLFLLLLAGLSGLGGFGAREAAAQIRVHRNLTVDGGLVQSQVLAIAEDGDGYLWFATNDGVSRYDGLGFTNFQTKDGLPPGPVRAIQPGPGGTLYLATDSGVVLFAAGRLTPAAASTGLWGAPAAALAAAPDGGLLVLFADRVVALDRAGRPTTMRLTAGAPPRTFVSLLAARDGTLWVGTAGGGVLVDRRRSGGGVRAFGTAEGLPTGTVRVLAEGRDGAVYAGTEQGLAVWRGTKEGHFESAGTSQAILSVAEGADGTLYVGTLAAGVLIGRPGAFTPLTAGQGLAWDRVYAVHETRDGTVYLGTDRGVSVYDRGLIESWTGRTGLPDDAVWSIAEDGAGAIWLGTGRGLAARRAVRGMAANTWRSLDRRHGLPDDTVRSLRIGPSGRLYAGTQFGGVAVFDRPDAATGGPDRVLDRRSGLASDFVRAIWETADGTTYFGTEEGLSVLRSESAGLSSGALSTYRRADGLAGDTVTSIAPVPGDPQAVYLGTTGGLTLFRGGAVRSWTRTDGLADSVVWSVLPAADGALLVGTAHGLSVLRGGRVVATLDANHGLTNDTVYCMLQDAAGLVYLNSNRGVNVVDLSLLGPPGPSGSPAGVPADTGRPAVRALLSADGLASNEGNLGACFRDAAGRLWFGSVAGVSVYDPRRAPPRREPPRVHISGLRLFSGEVPLPLAPRAAFRASENYFTFDFVGLALAAPHRVLYRYRLAGLDRGWTETDRRSVQYTNLDPGGYRFEVQAADAGWRRWSAPAVLSFRILTPLWRRWWFLLLTALALGSAVAAILSYRVRQLLAIERLRTALAADLHDHIGTGLTEIAILSEIAARRGGGGGPDAATSGAGEPAATGVGEPAALPELGRMADIARQLVDRMNDIVWLVNPRRDSLHELFLRLKDSYAELFSGSGVVFKTSNLRLFEHVRLPMTYRENLYLIFKEALSNSLRHSGCREIELAVSLDGRRLEVVLEDDGCGLDADRSEADGGAGDGLGNMRRRAERIGGAVAFERRPEGGTRVRFTGLLA